MPIFNNLESRKVNLNSLTESMKILFKELGSKIHGDTFSVSRYDSDIGKSVKGNPIIMLFPENVSED